MPATRKVRKSNLKQSSNKNRLSAAAKPASTLPKKAQTLVGHSKRAIKKSIRQTMGYMAKPTSGRSKNK